MMFLSRAKKILLSATLATGIFFGSNVADAENFRDAEYFGSDGLDLINAAPAYEKAFTGKGIFIGVLDQPVNFSHPKFTAKSFSEIIRDSRMSGGTKGVYDWQAVFHGTHVAAIAAGSRDGNVMHGTAFDAEILNAPFNTDYAVDEGQRETDIKDVFTPYLKRGEIKVINNSWGSSIYLDEILPDDEIKKLLEASGEDWNMITDAIESAILKLHRGLKPLFKSIAQAVNAKRLTIFAAGNAGHSGSCLQSQASWFNDNAEFYLLNVSNLYNKFADGNGGLVRNADGTISGDWLLNFTSDGVKYLEDSSVAAPGTEILSANSNFAADGQAYIRCSGTSMATPFVTGTAALVQQAFPYMDGKQIADVILSTANKNIRLENNFRVSLRKDIDVDNDGNKNQTTFLCVYYFDDKDRTEDEVVADLNRYVDSYRFYAEKNADAEIRKAFKDVLKVVVERHGLKVYFATPLQSLIGQGVVDAGKAVNGLAALNARRLNANDISTAFGEKIALYTVDTKGFDSTWSNDICEIREGKLAPEGTEPDLIERYNYYHENWLSKNLTDYNKAYWSDILTERYVAGFNADVDKDGLEGLHVGLKKIGDGHLTLSGSNTYEGATVVEGGTLSIDGKISGDAYTSANGTLAGRGTIDGTLFNRATAEAGDSSGGNLTVGNLTSSGKLIVNVSSAGNTKFVVRGTANLDGSTFVVAGDKPSGGEIVALTADKITGNVKAADSSYRVEIRGNSVVIVFK